MRRRLPVVVIMALGLTLMLGFGLSAQVKKDQRTGQDRLDGKIQTVDKAKSSFTIMQSSATTKATWHVVYNDKTKFTTHSKPAKLDDLKEGKRVIILGKFAQNVMTASQVDFR
jgi:cytochrome c-type biogenesis protein CcmE